MANVWAIHSVGDSLVQYLRDSYEPFAQANESGPSPVPDCTFRLLSSLAFDDMESADDDNQLSLYLYRVNINEHLRNSRRSSGQFNGQSSGSSAKEPLSLDLHFLMTAWSKNAMAEQLILAWAMRQLHDHPLLDRSYLSAQANWDREDVVQLIPAELTHEDMMRIWDTLKPAYRLSFGYVARVVRIESEQVGSDLPVVATRMVWGESVEDNS